MASVTYNKCNLWQMYYGKCNYGKNNYGKNIMANETDSYLRRSCLYEAKEKLTEKKYFSIQKYNSIFNIFDQISWVSL